MTNIIKLKRSSVSGNKPTTGDIAVGEVALNMADQLIHYRDGSDNIKGIVHDPDSALSATSGSFDGNATADTLTATTSLDVSLIDTSGTVTFDTAGVNIANNTAGVTVRGDQYLLGGGGSYAAVLKQVRSRNSALGNVRSASSLKLEETDGSGNLVAVTTGAGVDFSMEVNNGEIANIYGKVTSAASDGSNNLDVANSESAFGVLLRGQGAVIQALEVRPFDNQVQLEGNDTGNPIEIYTGSSTGITVQDTKFTSDGTDQTITSTGDLFVSTGGYIKTSGILNQANNGLQQIIGLRDNAAGGDFGGFAAIQSYAGNNLATLGNEQTGGIQMSVRGDDADGTAGVITGIYNGSGNSSILLKTFNVGASGYLANTAQFGESEVSLLVGDLTLETDGTDQTITPAGVLDIRESGGGSMIKAIAGDQVRMLDEKLRFQKFTSDVLIKPAPGYAYTFESANNDQAITISDTQIQVNVAGSAVLAIDSSDSDFNLWSNDFVIATDGTNQTIDTAGSLTLTTTTDLNLVTGSGNYVNTNGILNTATSGAEQIVGLRDNAAGGDFGGFAAIQSYSGSNLSALSGEQTGGFQMTVRGDDQDGTAGVVTAIYNGSGNSSILLRTFNVGAPGYLANTAQFGENSVSLLTGDLTITDDGTDQTITGSGEVKFGSVVQLQNLSSDPTASTGSMYFNTSTGKFRGYNGTSWVDLG